MRLSLQNICLSLITTVMIASVQAQTNPCLTNLKDANSMTEKGKYDEAINLIKNTLDNCNLSKNDKIQANKLLIVNYLAIDNLEEADATAATIMKLNPNYEPDKLRDDFKLIGLFEKYKPTIVLNGIAFGGINFSQVNASQTYSMVTDNNAAGLDNYQSLTGFQMGLGAEFRVLPSFWIQTLIQYRRSAYAIAIPNVQGRTISYMEALNYFEIPLSAKYYIGKGRLKPFGQAGINFSLLNSALGELSRNDVSDIVNREAQRNTFYVGYFGGLGLAYDFKAFSIQAGLNYMYVPKNINKEGTRYDNSDAVFKYYYLDNDFTMRNIALNFGFTYALGYKNVLTNKAKK